MEIPIPGGTIFVLRAQGQFQYHNRPGIVISCFVSKAAMMCAKFQSDMSILTCNLNKLITLQVLSDSEMGSISVLLYLTVLTLNMRVISV